MSNAIGLTEGGDSATDTIGASGGGGAATISIGSAVVRPIGISPSIHKAPGEDWFRGNQWQPENTEPPGPAAPGPWLPNQIRHFTPVIAPPVPPSLGVTAVMPPRAWDPVYYQIVLLTEFARNWQPTPATEAHLTTVLASALSPGGQKAERDNLDAMIAFRQGALSEVIAEMTGFDTYFMGALGYSQVTHPATNQLVKGAVRVAEFVAMYYKNFYQRARPSQLWPELMPPIPVPGHAAYPSAHSTQAHTIAKVLQAVAASVVPSVHDITERLAQRIRRGREVLGVHYPSDSEAGEFLSYEIATVFLNGPTVHALADAARHEWQAYAT